MSVPIVKKIKYDPKGGTIWVELQFDTKLLSTYELDIREAGSNKSIPPFPMSGDNTNPEGDKFPLPVPTTSNDGRTAWAFINIMDQTGDGGSYQCFMIFSQDGNEIGRIQTDRKKIKGNIGMEMFVAKLIASAR